jgi:hypothetical protein
MGFNLKSGQSRMAKWRSGPVDKGRMRATNLEQCRKRITWDGIFTWSGDGVSSVN